MKLEIENQPLPASEFSGDFVGGMMARMATSFYTYGKLAEAYPVRVDAIA